MIMPIVAMRPMAMNESVASTCCYREVASPSSYYREVLYGGQIESGPKAVMEWAAGISPDWKQLAYDIDFSAYTGLRAVPFFNSLMNGWWVLFFDGDAVTSASSIEAFIENPAAGVRVVNYGCTHADADCLYITELLPGIVHDHIGATKQHDTGGIDWVSPHEALRFNS